MANEQQILEPTKAKDLELSKTIPVLKTQILIDKISKHLERFKEILELNKEKIRKFDYEQGVIAIRDISAYYKKTVKEQKQDLKWLDSFEGFLAVTVDYLEESSKKLKNPEKLSPLANAFFSIQSFLSGKVINDFGDAQKIKAWTKIFPKVRDLMYVNNLAVLVFYAKHFDVLKFDLEKVENVEKLIGKYSSKGFLDEPEHDKAYYNARILLHYIFDNPNFEPSESFGVKFADFSNSVNRLIALRIKFEEKVKQFNQYNLSESDDYSLLIVKSYFELKQRNIKLDVLISEIQNRVEEKISKLANFSKFNKGKLENLRKSADYPHGLTGLVRQGEAAFISKSSRSKEIGLYTARAEMCSIVVTVSRDENGEISAVGLSHVDPGTEDEELKKLFVTARKYGKVEISIVSGTLFKSQNLFDIASLYGKVVFVNCDINGERDDALAVDKNGNLYYGENKRLDKAAEKIGGFGRDEVREKEDYKIFYDRVFEVKN